MRHIGLSHAQISIERGLKRVRCVASRRSLEGRGELVSSYFIDLQLPEPQLGSLLRYSGVYLLYPLAKPRRPFKRETSSGCPSTRDPFFG